MDNSFIQSFVERFNRDKEEFNIRFDELNRKLKNIDSRFDDFDIGIRNIDERIDDIDSKQDEFYKDLGNLVNKFENIEIYLNTIDTKINEYKTLYLEGERMLDGNLIKLRIELQKVKPVVNWENNLRLSSRYKEIEKKLLEFEDTGKL